MSKKQTKPQNFWNGCIGSVDICAFSQFLNLKTKGLKANYLFVQILMRTPRLFLIEYIIFLKLWLVEIIMRTIQHLNNSIDSVIF